PDEEADICILEEPEHLNWVRAAGPAWTDKFEYVVGIIHTNYMGYAPDKVQRVALGTLSALTVRAHCHRIIKLSDTLQTYAGEKEMVSNVHGVRKREIDR
ncbi:unnamed protein product, partial [Discosporangium mesarthrocarpum]